MIIQFILSVGILLRYKGARTLSTHKEIESVGVMARDSRGITVQVTGFNGLP